VLLEHKPVPKMRDELIQLFKRTELSKYLTDEELARLEGQLNHILDQYAILAQLDTDAIPPTAQTIELENILRDDVVQPSFTPDEALANAPERDGDFIVVPPIIGDSEP